MLCSIFFVSLLINQINFILSDCTIDIKELAEKDPLLVTKTGELLIGSGSALKLSNGETGYAICSGSRNLFVNEGAKNEVLITCKDNKVKIDDRIKNVSDAECSTTITGDIINKSIDCAKSGTLHLIGFHTKRFGFIEYIKVCYDLKKASVIYTYHKIHGQAIRDSNTERPVFKVSGIPKDVKPALSYKQSYQKERLKDLLGSEKLAAKYITSTSFLARGHLTPDADGVFKSWQHATYFYMNVAPEWQVVNSGNWLRVENVARKKAEKLKANLEVYTGVFDILTLPDINGNEVPLSLDPKEKIVVPKWYWKILKYKNEGIAFITLNNPFAKYIKKLCKDICNIYGWDNEEFNNMAKGYTYCCAVSDFLHAIKGNGPKNLQVNNVLSF